MTAESSGCDAHPWYAPWICSLSWDNTHVQGVYATYTYGAVSLNGDQGASLWPGLVTATNDFIQVGYQRSTDTSGQDTLFVQAYQQGHFSDACNTTYVICRYYTVDPPLVLGTRYTFQLNSGVDGVTNKWGFFIASDRIDAITLGSSDSGGNTPQSFTERVGTYPRHAVFPQTYWDCGLCQYKGGVWAGSYHADYQIEDYPGCPGMGSFYEVGGQEFYLASGSQPTTCPSGGSRVW